jgi:hypothetical protein
MIKDIFIGGLWRKIGLRRTFGFDKSREYFHHLSCSVVQEANSEQALSLVFPCPASASLYLRVEPLVCFKLLHWISNIKGRPKLVLFKL